VVTADCSKTAEQPQWIKNDQSLDHHELSYSVSTVLIIGCGIGELALLRLMPLPIGVISYIIPLNKEIGGWFGTVVDGIGHINKVKLCWAWLILGLMTTFGSTISVFIQATRANLSWPSPWVGAMSTGDGFGFRLRRNCKLCVVLGPVTRTASVLAYRMLA